MCSMELLDVVLVVLLLGIGSFPCCYLCQEVCVEEERLVLLQIKESINYPNGSSLPDWNGEDCCKWNGIDCRFNVSGVTALSLDHAREKALGTWYPNATLFSQFKNIEYLNLGGNQISGWIMPQDLCRLNNLRNLVLNENQLSDLPHCMKSLPYLEYLDMSSNNLTESSSLEGWLCGLKSLNILYLSHNRLEGSVPPCLGTIQSISDLDLSFNQFKETIPVSILANLTGIASLSLSNNQFTGTLPFAMFANHPGLTIIDLSNNTELIVNTEDRSWSPSFQLLSLKLSNCNLNRQCGKIPSFLSTQSILMEMDLSHNGLQGDIPSFLFQNNSILSIINLRNNSLEIPFSHAFFGNTSFILFIDVSHNYMYGPLPSDIGERLPSLEFLNISTNNLRGNVPSSLGRINMLGILDLSYNGLVGEIPKQLISNSTFLKYMDLSQNRLEGEMLPKHSNMSNLEVLYLDGNGFTGTIAPSLSNSPLLKVLDIRNNYISGKIPSWLPALSKLIVVLLRGNRFEDQIPYELCQMQNLRILDLSHNRLSGEIPTCFNNVTAWKSRSPTESFHPMPAISSLNGTTLLAGGFLIIAIEFSSKGNSYSYQGIVLSLMTGIDVSNNRLIGDIPQELGYLKELHAMNLSNNYLTGPIPESFENLEQIESLDMSFNQLNGPIPRSLDQLHFISYFSVAHNNLSGKIPDFKNQLSTFDESSYQGNLGLCGHPLKKRCPLPKVVTKDGESRVNDNPFLFYSFIVFSYVLGFSSVISFLFFNRDMRLKYFEIIDDCIEYCITYFLRLLRRS